MEARRSFPKGQRGFRRLAALSALEGADWAALDAARRKSRIVPARRDIHMEDDGHMEGDGGGAPMDGPGHSPSLLLLEGWAYRVHLLADGRRQILQFLLPGDLMEDVRACGAHAGSLVALTDIRVCAAPDSPIENGGLARAYAASRRLERGYLYRHAIRLGRLSAYERILDWLCEMHERLTIGVCCDGDRMILPLTQEVIADALGLTSVHVNRTLQALRRDGLVRVSGRKVEFIDPLACRNLVDRP